MPAALPPAGAWTTPEALAAALRTAVTDTNRDALQACCDAAALEIVDAIDAPDPASLPAVDDPLCQRVNLLRSLEFWKSNDAIWGVAGFAETGVVRTPRDGFARHALVLMPHKQGFGVA
jgi:hypothetical protein